MGNDADAAIVALPDDMRDSVPAIASALFSNVQ